ncbi:hypothetical protein [Arthrobacter sp. KNU40]|uniref:hypothetical protein n=1 Tax=Arthrobacter sp. KNU40 TaxID=3447965 RepID=UPI003F618C26
MEIEFEAAGHLEGTGRVTITTGSHREETCLDIEWRVRPTQRWMHFLTPIAAPAFKAAHSLTMCQGELGLVKALTGGAPTTKQ